MFILDYWKACSGLPISDNLTFALDVTAEALRTKIDRKSAISLQRGQFDQRFQVEWVAPPIIFARIVRPMNALQLAFTQRNFNCSRLSSRKVRF